MKGEVIYSEIQCENCPFTATNLCDGCPLQAIQQTIHAVSNR